MNKICNNLKKKSNDIIYTPLPVALKMIEMCNIQIGDKVLDPCKGTGVFYNNLPKTCNKEYCEITENKDFFNETGRYDLIIGNPPYSLWTKWINHTMSLTDKFCYIFGIMNITDTRLNHIHNNGYGVTQIHLLKIDWWFGHQYLILFEKNKPSIISASNNCIYCDICNNKKCKRGRNNNSPNECPAVDISPI